MPYPWGMAHACEVSPSEQEQIQQWVTAHGTPQQVALRCRIVLSAAAGQSDVAIAEQLSINRKTAILWRNRFTEQRLDGLWEVAPGRGRKPTFDIDKIAAIVDATLRTKGRRKNRFTSPERERGCSSMQAVPDVGVA